MCKKIQIELNKNWIFTRVCKSLILQKIEKCETLQLIFNNCELGSFSVK